MNINSIQKFRSHFNKYQFNACVSFNNQNNQFVKRSASRYLFIHPQYAVRLSRVVSVAQNENTALIKVCCSNQLVVITCRCVLHRDLKLPTFLEFSVEIGLRESREYRAALLS